MSKYHAQKWHGYDSKREARRASDLRAMQDAGEISDLQEQVVFELIPSQWMCVETVGKKGQKIKPQRKCVERACSYVADFVYRDKETGRLVVEDAKGVRTPDYVIKRKLMLYFKDIHIQEI